MSRVTDLGLQDSEEMIQMRDLMANTDPVLLIVTIVVSFLHMIFEYLAFKADVSFWNSTDGDIIQKFISIKSLGESHMLHSGAHSLALSVAGIICQFVLLLYLWDENSNLLVLAFSAIAIVIDIWKVRPRLL